MNEVEKNKYCWKSYDGFTATELGRHTRRKQANSITFVVPCYNEVVEVVENTINGIRDALASTTIELEFILVNDGSTNSNYDQLEDRVGCIVINLPKNRGYGAALKVGLSHASNDWIGIVDADSTYPVSEFRNMVPFTAEYDMVVGARNWTDIATTRRHTKILITRVASWFANFDIPDLNSGMRLFHRDLVVSRWRLYPDRFSFSTTLTMFSLCNNHPTIFFPIRYGKRVGKSKIQPIKDTIRFITQLFRLAMYFRPLRFFLPLSGVFISLGAARSIRDIMLNDHLGGLSLLLFFMAFQILFFGLLAEIINKKN